MENATSSLRHATRHHGMKPDDPPGCGQEELYITIELVVRSCLIIIESILHGFGHLTVRLLYDLTSNETY